jgi:multiple sugar transport system substrate-binding protein
MIDAVEGASFTRRNFLRLAAGGATLLATGVGCDSGSDTNRSRANSATTPDGAKGRPTLRIAQYNHYVAGYDRWWEEEYTKRWGERNGIEVLIDHFDITQEEVHAQAEVASRRGHDIFQLHWVSTAFEDDVIDHAEIVQAVEAKVGRMTPFVERSVRNPRTGKYLGLPDYWVASPIHYRRDLWEPLGLRPDAWEHVIDGGRRLKARGYPVGIGMGPDLESSFGLVGLLHSFGASIQDENANVVINRPATVEAVKLGAKLFRQAMTDEVLGWDVPSNNRYLVSGRGSLIVNAVAAIRALEDQDPALAANVGLLPVPEGPAGRLTPYSVSIRMIWRFAENQEAAKQFLVDLATDYREPFLQSGYLQLPTFPGAVPDLAALVGSDARAQPPEKYALLAGAADWTTNLGHPGHTNAAVDEVVKTGIVSKMFATAARGEMSPEDAVRAAEARIKPIYDQWRERGKI